MNREEFISKIKQRYKDYLDFSKLEDINYDSQDRETKITFGCKKHGYFYKSVNNSLAVSKHKSGYLCPLCAKEHNRRSKDEWIEMFKEKHGDKFDYSLITEIEGNKIKLPIRCKKHNRIFYQDAAHHLNYEYCCPMCESEKMSSYFKYSLEDFLKKAKTVHGDKYDYSKVEYIDSQTRVCIICPKHGEFWQTPAAHLSGQGCVKCGIEKNADRIRKNTSIFIEQARKIHGDKYDYSKVEYVDAKTKVCIICPIHGEFWQTPDSHINGKAGCKKCAMDAVEITKPKDKEWFIERAKTVHGDKYDYSKVEYVNSQTKVCIICPIHGEFWQTPNDHLQGQGCRKCGGKLVTNLQEFIEQARKIHGDKYDYSKVEYVNSQTKVCIICPDHGEFWQAPNSHLQGQGCPICGRIKSDLNRRSTTEEFIERAKAVHGDKYDYSKVEYITNITEVCIICPIHGEFWQLPVVHLNGGGCQKCRQSKLEEEVAKKLRNKGIKFERWKGFDWLKYHKSMKVDFYLPEFDAVIECQGLQHFKKIEHFEKGNGGFEVTIKRDKKKKELCNKHNINVFYYSNLGIEYPYQVYESFNDMINDIKHYSYFKNLEEMLCEASTT